jgi:hypothetical protein
MPRWFSFDPRKKPRIAPIIQPESHTDDDVLPEETSTAPSGEIVQILPQAEEGASIADLVITVRVNGQEIQPTIVQKPPINLYKVRTLPRPKRKAKQRGNVRPRPTQNRGSRR